MSVDLSHDQLVDALGLKRAEAFQHVQGDGLHGLVAGLEPVNPLRCSAVEHFSLPLFEARHDRMASLDAPNCVRVARPKSELGQKHRLRPPAGRNGARLQRRRRWAFLGVRADVRNFPLGSGLN